MEGSRVGVQHSCTNSLSPWFSPAFWHREAVERLKEVRAREEMLLNAERGKQNRNFCCMDFITNQVSLFLSLKSDGTGIMWILSNIFLKVIDPKLLKILWYAMTSNSTDLSTGNKLQKPKNLKLPCWARLCPSFFLCASGPLHVVVSCMASLSFFFFFSYFFFPQGPL